MISLNRREYIPTSYVVCLQMTDRETYEFFLAIPDIPNTLNAEESCAVIIYTIHTYTYNCNAYYNRQVLCITDSRDKYYSTHARYI